MPSVCLFFKVHQPHRFSRYSIFDIDSNKSYFDDERNKFYLDRIVKKCYEPSLLTIKDLIGKTGGAFKASFGITGTLLEQLERWHPSVIKLFQDLAKTGAIEFTGETYYHTLSSIYSKEEFKRQVKLHQEKIQSLFDQTPIVFSNTELVYFNDLASTIKELGFQGVLAEGADWILTWRSPNFVYRSKDNNLKILLRNYRLSDDISFRFSSRDWAEWPLTADKFGHWIGKVNGNGEVVNLFMDFETFGEHQWPETGIFEFLKALPDEILKQPNFDFKTVSQAIKTYPARGIFDVTTPVSWADIERDLSAWLSNQMQQSAAKEIFDLEKQVLKTDSELIKVWRKLQTSDHFYYMCTKWFSDGDVHKYFNPYETPYDAYISYMNILEDLKHKLSLKVKKKSVQTKPHRRVAKKTKKIRLRRKQAKKSTRPRARPQQRLKNKK